MSYKYKLYGAIFGDLAGQPYEFKYKGDYSEFNLHDEKSTFTDDTLMTLATAKALLEEDNNFKKWYLLIGSKYWDKDYFGKRFKKWMQDEIACELSESDSWGNGCLMKVSPCMYIPNRENSQYLTIESCLSSHCHPQSIIACNNLFMQYQLSQSIDKDFLIRNKVNKIQNYHKFDKFDVSSKGTFEFIKKIAFSSYSTQLTIKNTVKCGGDTDTNASIIGELMNYTFQDITKQDAEYVESKLDPYLLDILHQFNKKF